MDELKLPSEPKATPARRTPKKRAESPWVGRTRASDQSFEERRLAVLQKAAEMFWKNGFHETSFEMLADALSITKPTVYYYVKSKQECLAEVGRLGQEGALYALRHAERVEGTGLDRLIYVFRQYIDSTTTDFGKCINLARRHLTGNEHREMMARIDWADRQFYKLYEDAVDEGSIEVSNKRVIYELVVGSLNWVSEWFNPAGTLSQNEVANLHIEALVRLLKPSLSGR